MQEIVVDIDRDGTVKIEGVGFKGAECKKYSAAVEEALGETTGVQLKPEFRQAKPQLRTKAG